MKNISLLLLILFSFIASFSCKGHDADSYANEFVQRYDTLIDVRGPVKRITYSYQTSENIKHILYYSVKEVDFLSSGRIWSFSMTTEDLKFVNYEVTDDNCLIVNAVESDGLDASIDYVYDEEQHRLKSIQACAAPEYDGYEYVINYNQDSELCGINFVDVTWDVQEQDFRKDSTQLSLVGKELDEHGNWTSYKFENDDMFILVNRFIEYYSEDELKENVTTWEGKELIPCVEIVGDFNADGKTEKAWVDNPFDESGGLKDDFSEHPLYFSDADLKPIYFGKSLGNSIYNIGDLNNDGRDDIGTTEVKPAGAWNVFNVWLSTPNNSWEFATSFMIREELFELFDVPIRRNDKGEIEIWCSDDTDYNESDPSWEPFKNRFDIITICTDFNKTRWVKNKEGNFSYPSCFSYREDDDDELPATIETYSYADIELCYFPILGVWATFVDNYPIVGSVVGRDSKIASITYTNNKGIYSGYTDDGRIFYMNTLISGGEVSHAHTLVLIYPKSKQKLMDRLVKEVQHWKLPYAG